MSEPSPAAHRGRSIWKLTFRVGVAVSVLLNLGLITKIAVFDAYYPFHPICFAGKHDGYLVLTEPMNNRFKGEMQQSLANLRMAAGRKLYISYWMWTNQHEDIWNITRAVAEYLYEREKGIKRMTQDQRERLQTWRCKFIRKYALKKPKAQ